jgi:hypothetical protein
MKCRLKAGRGGWPASSVQSAQSIPLGYRSLYDSSKSCVVLRAQMTKTLRTVTECSLNIPVDTLASSASTHQHPLKRPRKLNIRDVSSEHAQRAKGITLQSIDRYNQRNSEWLEVLVEDKSASPADVAATRIDFAAWLRTLSSKQRRMATTLATGESTGAAARITGVSAARVSQLRRELWFLWDVFQGQAESHDAAPTQSRAPHHCCLLAE